MDFKCDELILGKKDADSRALTVKSLRYFWFFLFFYVSFGMHFFMHNQGGAGLYLPFNMVGWIFISIFISAGLWHLTIVKKIVFSSVFFWYVIGFVILLFPFFNPQGEWNSLAEPRFIAIFAGLLLLFSLAQFNFSENQRYLFLYFLLISIAIESVFGLVQIFFLKENNWIGYNVRINRPYGIFQKDSVYSSFLVAGLSIVLYLQRWDVRVLTSPWRQGLLSIILFMTPLLLVHVQSRVGIYSATLVVICMLPILWNYNRNIFWCTLFVLLASFVASQVNFNATRSIESYEQSSNYRRLYWSHLLSMLPQSMWFGHGYGSFEYTFLHDFYAPENIKSGMNLMEENLDHPHNEILFWLHEGGVIAIIGLMVFMAGYIRSVLKCMGWSKRLSLLVLTLPLIFHSMVEYPFYHSVAHFFFFIVFLWLADAESSQQKVYVCQFWFLARVLAIAIPLAVVPFMLTGLQEAYILTKYDRSKDKDPLVLEQIINPLPLFMFYEFQMRSVQLTFSSTMHDKAGLESYVTWAKQFLHGTPRAVVYLRLVYALQQLNDIKQAKIWLEEGKRLFPQADFLQKFSLLE